jgi:hypothetical protein
MGWSHTKPGSGGAPPKIDIIYEGPKAVDARIYFGKFCHDRNKGILLSEILGLPKGFGYVIWLSTEFDKASDELIEACESVINDLERYA